MNDYNMIKKCKQGDKEAFQLLISRYHPFVYKFLLKAAQNEQIAEDLTQEIFLKMVRGIDKFDLDGRAAFSTYIITVSRNTYIDFLRKEKRHIHNVPIEEGLNIQDTGVSVEDAVADRLCGQNIMADLNNLSEEQRTAIKLKYIEGMTLKEISEKLNIEPKTVKSRIHNGIVRLRKLLGKGDIYEGD